MSAIEPKTLGAIALGLLLLLAIGILLIRSGLKSRRRQTPSPQPSSARIVHAPVAVPPAPVSRPETVAKPTPVARPETRPAPLIVPGPTVLPADDAVIDLRVSFDATATRPSVRPSAATTVSIAVINGDPSALLRSIASELAKAKYYLRPERPYEGWLSSVYDRRQNQAGELAASKNDAQTSTITLSMRDYGASLELVDRAIIATGYALLTRDRVQDRHQYSYIDGAGGRVRATLTEATSQVPKNG